jgi:ketopantoate hydroxymethyltransferase
MEYGAEARAGRVALDNELAVEVRQLQHRGSRQCTLQGAESHLGVTVPLESLLQQQLCEGRHDRVVVADEPAIVAGQPEECAHGAH